MNKPIRLSTIKAPIAEEMKEFNALFKQSLSSKVPLLDKISHFLVRRKGKQMRPLFVLLSAKMISGEISEKTFTAATLIEMMHTATLVHDDVVDDANKRRGFFSVNALWKNKIAVLVGDFLLSKSLILAVEQEEFAQLKNLSTAVKKMSEGELLQIEKARKLDITEDVYFEIINAKTASLIKSACRAGALSVTDDSEVIELLGEIGETIGIAFQIKDDLFDYYESSKIGKPTGIDIKEQKMTLPLIYTLQNVSTKEKRFIINSIKKHNHNKKRVSEVIKMVHQSGGIEYTETKMYFYRDRAVELINKFPNSEAKQSLLDLVQYTIERKK